MADEKTALATRIVAAYLRRNSVAVSEIPELIRVTHTALARVVSPEPQQAERQQPAVTVKKSVTADAIACLECGKHQKMLKRHLQTAHGLTVDEYRAKWALPSDYPMVAPNYAQHRSQLAVKIGLGRKKAVETPAKAESTGAAATKPRHQYPSSRWSRSAD
jgi:predicted transcriptional regulator